MGDLASCDKIGRSENASFVDEEYRDVVHDRIGGTTFDTDKAFLFL